MRSPLIVIANREPYIHHRSNSGEIEVLRPASGLVTALEPILRNSGGLWIAHGSGNADREKTDASGRVEVPPGHPTYQLQRVWLSEEQEKGYYYGFSNEGLWPLCHQAHTRPIFRLQDWHAYQEVNSLFAAAVPVSLAPPKSSQSTKPIQNDEFSEEEPPLILVQDYHFALLPQLLRARQAGLRIALFWHIPWPHPEAFGICPWGKELLAGILGSDLVGFHTQTHCNNFLETCDRYLEARIDRENFSVIRGESQTFVRPFPIGIHTAPVRHLSIREVENLKARYGIQAQYVAVGVDRVDYTKGLPERLDALERLFEKYPRYRGKLSFVQIASPSRVGIPAYDQLLSALRDKAKAINERFRHPDLPNWLPIHWWEKHHDWEEIQYFYQIGDLCLVTSLHDGMNLVAKEYVWCQAPERGALVLSQFAGASRELTEAIIINPYSIEQLADSIHLGLSMPIEERIRRMSRMRERIRTHNAFHWASDIVQSLRRLALDNTIGPVRNGPHDLSGTRIKDPFRRNLPLSGL